ncbi:MAG: transporter substrate-binding domain-containing protein [Desulfobacterales bacterium]|nr:transporter substrate-binding domain-containing protein [Desulfobacterales bacterium]MCP4164222.1 transporter substrate-binding domain-containing protein [Deltaproteobacteria bacterium]
MRKEIIILSILTIFYSQTSAEVLKLGVLDFPPYEYQAKNKVDGMSVDIVKHVFKKMNKPLTFMLLPWSRALKYLENGEIDGLFEMLKKPEREKYADYSKVVLMNEYTSLFVLKESNIAYRKDLSELGNYVFGLRQDFSYGAKFDYARKKKIIKKIVTSPFPQNLFRYLSYGQIDILVGDKFGIPYHYKKTRLENNKYIKIKFKKIKRLSPDIQSVPAYIAFSKKKNLTDLRDRFDTILLGMKKNGTYFEILEKWRQRLKTK